jgi:hypothetical protein
METDLLAALESHPGNPLNEAKSNGAPKTYADKGAVLRALAANEINVTKASDLLAQFESKASNVEAVLNLDELRKCPKTFSTGNTGFYAGGKILIDGVRYQATVNVVKIKSKSKS